MGAVFACFVVAAPAQTTVPVRAARQYDSRIQMHTAPVTLQVPDNDFETEKGAPESSDLDLTVPTSAPERPQARPNGPRRKGLQEKQQNKNWILPPSTKTESEKDNEETTLDQQKEEPVHSGWGWLADDVRARQLKQKERDDKTQDDSEEKNSEFKPPSALPKEDDQPKSDGIFLDTAFKPVSGAIPAKDNRDEDDEDVSAQDENPNARDNKPAGPTTAESPSSRTSADQAGQRKFGADATWGNESIWSKDEKPAGSLPQTEALLSVPKLEARRQIADLGRPAFKPDAGGSVDQVGPNQRESPRPDFTAASSFQPLPAAPVNELGSTPWDRGSSASAPFSGSAPFSAQPSTPPAQPIEVLKAPELPKPVVTPWLK
jgi:hypothetical protein